MNKAKLDRVSFIIISYNVERTLPKLLKSFEQQDFPKSKYEILLIDGKSTDRTLTIAKSANLPLRIIQSPYPKDPEACRVVGIKEAKYDLFCFVDADNYFHHTKWISNIVKVLKNYPDVYGAYAWRYLYDKKENIINRYFALLGAADPVGFYLKKDDRLSYLYDKWNLAGDVIEETKEYLVIAYPPEEFPTLGSNAAFFRKDLLLNTLKVTYKNFFHIDTSYDMAKKGYNKYLLYKDGIGHSATNSAISFLKRRARYMGLHYVHRAKSRRYKVFDSSRRDDIINLGKFVVFSITFIEPLIFSIRGFIKIRDYAWFIHPLFCLAICITYSWTIAKGIFSRLRHDNI